jgi:hypothetical protein
MIGMAHESTYLILEASRAALPHEGVLHSVGNAFNDSFLV